MIALDREDSTDTAYMDAGLRMLDEIDLLVAVWDGQAARGLGGTAQLVDAAKQLHLPRGDLARRGGPLSVRSAHDRC